MNSLIIYTFVILVVINIEGIHGHSLPSYVVPCSRSDPKLSECATNIAKAGSRLFALGDKSRGLAPLDPIFIKEIKAINSQGGGGLKLVLKDSILTGPADMAVKKIKVNWPKKKVTIKVFGNINIDSDYEMDGRLLIIPLVGKGKSHIKLENVLLTYTFYFDLVKEDDGKEYAHFLKDSISYDIGRAYFDMENLFNGNKLLGENTNILLNDSWQEVIAELGPPAAEELRKAVASVVKVFFKLAPFDEILLQ